MKKLSIVLILAGIIVLLLPLFGQMMTARRQAELLEELEKSFESKPAVETIGSLETEDNSSGLPEDVLPNPDAADCSGADGSSVVARIVIDKIDLDLPVLPGVTRDVMKDGIGCMQISAPFGSEGNVILAGHRNYPYGKMFNRLDELEAGDEILIETENDSFTYAVSEKFIVLPNDLSVLDEVGDRKMMTLITCAPAGQDTHRLIVRAFLE